MSPPEALRRSGSQSALRSALAELPVGLSAALLGFFLLVKLYAVSHFSLTTAAAIVGSSAGQVLVGTFASYLYLLVSVSAFVLLFLWIRAGGFALGALWSILLVTGFILLSLISPFNPWWKALIAFMLLEFVFYARNSPAWALDPPQRLRNWAKGLPPTQLGRLRALRQGWISHRTQPWIVFLDVVTVVAGLVLAVTTVFPTLDQPWLGAEVIQFSHPEVTTQHQVGHRGLASTDLVVGYVLTDQGDWVSILSADRRFVMVVPSSEVGARFVCRVEGNVATGRRPIYQAIRGQNYDSPNTDCGSVRDLVLAGKIGK